jgi:hypothetical protein
MAKDTGKGSRKGAVTARTQGKNPKTKDWTKRNETPGSKKKGDYTDVKSGGKPFKGVAKEKDRRRTGGDTGKGKASHGSKRRTGSNTTGVKRRP